MHSMDRRYNWSVLLIGGHSGTGKTVVSQRLARRYGVGLAQVDDFRLVLQRMTTPSQQPALHKILRIVSAPDASPEAASEALIQVAQTMSYALEIVVAHHVATHTPLILEGDGIVPAFAAQPVFDGWDVGNSVRAVFLIEADEQQLFRSASKRGRGFEDLSPNQQDKSVRRSWLYGQWLAREAARFGVPVVTSQPWETLEERVVKIIE